MIINVFKFNHIPFKLKYLQVNQQLNIQPPYSNILKNQYIALNQVFITYPGLSGGCL